MPKGMLVLLFIGLIFLPLPEGDPLLLSLAGPTISGLSQILFSTKMFSFLVNFKAGILEG
jgi:hypothetical protein